MLPSPLGSGSDLDALDIGGADDPRRPFADLICGKSAFDNQAANGRGTDGEGLGRLVQRRLAALGAFALSVDGDAVNVAQSGHPRSRPRMPLGRRLPGPIESGRDPHVRHLSGHRPHQIDDIGVGTPAVLLAMIDVFLDNARYHHAKIVQEWLAQPGRRIALHFIPAYCPHLNPIERLWALMHQHLTHNKTYPTCREFADAILNFLRDEVPRKWGEFCDSVTDNFRVILPANFRILA